MFSYVYSNPDHSVVLRSDGAYIPINEENIDYQTLLSSGANISPYEPVVIPKTRLYKATIWRRCTDAEYDAIQAVLSATPLRIQAIFRDADYLSIGDELYPMIVAGATQAVGAERAAELLEPEE